MQLHVYGSIRVYITADMKRAIIFRPYGRYFILRVDAKSCIFEMVREMVEIREKVRVYTLADYRSLSPRNIDLEVTAA